MSIKNNVALVTSAGAIGTAIAVKFAKEGANVIVSDIDAEKLEKTQKDLEAYGTKIVTVPCNMGVIEDIDRVFDAVEHNFGKLDILVNTAGIAGPTKSIVDLSVEEWDFTMDVNLRSQFYCIKKAAPYMIKAGFGKIVCMSSQSGKRALDSRSPYCASKMGILGLARVAALELGKYNITVNSVCPGPVDSERIISVWTNAAKAQGLTFEEVRERWMQPAMLKRLVPVEDIAEAVLFFSDEEKSNSITGQDLNVNVGIITY